METQQYILHIPVMSLIQTIQQRVESGSLLKHSVCRFFLAVIRLFFLISKMKRKKTNTNKFRHPSRTYVAFVKIRDQKEEKNMLFSF